MWVAQVETNVFFELFKHQHVMLYVVNLARTSASRQGKANTCLQSSHTLNNDLLFQNAFATDAKHLRDQTLVLVSYGRKL